MNYYSLCEDFLCIKNMDERHKNSFMKLVDTYAGGMYTKTVISGRPNIVYDFERHCCNLFKIISNIIFDEAIVYNKDTGLNQTELYMLNLGVLLHAISIFEGNISRLCDYSKESANIIKQWVSNNSLGFNSNCLLKPAECYTLIDIIRVHNDSTNDASKACDLTELNSLEDVKEFYGGTIRSRLLAGVLRLANKMDFTAERLGDDDSEEQLRRMIEEKSYPIESEEEFIKSKRDFEKLHYISTMERSENRQQVILVIDDHYVEKRINDGSDLDDIRDFLITLYKELELELSEIKTKVFDTYEAAHYVQLKEIVFKTNNKELETRLITKMRLMNHGQHKSYSYQESDDYNTQPVNHDEIHQGKISLVSDDIAKRLSKEVSARNLLKFGHFRLDNQYCARDWIDTRELVETEKILSEMVKHIITHISTNISEVDLIIGVDLVGSLLASRLGFPLNCPMTYVIPDIVIPYSSRQDIDVNISQYNRIIIVVDSIVTGETLKKLIYERELENKIVAIYTMFYRNCHAPMFLEDSLLSKTYCLNNSYGAEVYDMKNCPYKEKKCMARNSRVY